jgi:hypothetical protein
MSCFSSEAQKLARERDRMIEMAMKKGRKEIKQEIKLLLLGVA